MWNRISDPEGVQTALVLRTCNADMTSYGGFVWPAEGAVQCDDWSETPICKGGLFGLLWGEGNGDRLSWGTDAKWLVVRVLLDDVVEIDGEKVKYPRGIVEHCGTQETATRYIVEHGGAGRSIVGLSIVSGYSGKSVSGYSGKSVSGDSGILCISYWDSPNERERFAIAYVGENGIKANTPYKLNSANEFEEAEE